MNDGASAAFYQRDPEHFRDLMRRTLEIHERFYREWPRLAQDYRDKLPDVTSPEAWEKTFAALEPRTEDAMRAANKSDGAELDEQKRRRRTRRMLRNQADAMPVVEAEGEKAVRVVDAELVEPAPAGGLLEVFQQPYLLRLLVSRQLAQQYAASLLGLAWSYIQPAMRFAVYYFVMGFILKLHDDVPYFALHLFTGIVVVHYFGETWNGGTRSIWANKGLVKDAHAPGDLPGGLDRSWRRTTRCRRCSCSCCSACSRGGTSRGEPSVRVRSGWRSWSPSRWRWRCSSRRSTCSSATSRTSSQTVMQFMHFLVPMMYPFSLVWAEHDSHPVLYQIYVANPVTQAVLLLQQFFWYPLIEDPSDLPRQFPPDLLGARPHHPGRLPGAAAGSRSGSSRRLEGKFPERL